MAWTGSSTQSRQRKQQTECATQRLKSSAAGTLKSAAVICDLPCPAACASTLRHDANDCFETANSGDEEHSLFSLNMCASENWMLYWGSAVQSGTHGSILDIDFARWLAPMVASP